MHEIFVHKNKRGHDCLIHISREFQMIQGPDIRREICEDEARAIYDALKEMLPPDTKEALVNLMEYGSL